MSLVPGNPPLFQKPKISGICGGEEPEDDPVFFRSHIVASGADVSARNAVADAPCDANDNGVLADPPRLLSITGLAFSFLVCPLLRGFIGQCT